MVKTSVVSKEIERLIYKIAKSGFSPLIHKTKAIKNLPVPKNMNELRSFFGFRNHNINFDPNLAILKSPCRPLLSKLFVCLEMKTTQKHLRELNKKL